MCVKSKESLRALTVVHLCDVKLSRQIHLSCKLNNRCQPKTGVPLRIALMFLIRLPGIGKVRITQISVLDIEPSFLTLLAFFSFKYTHSLEILLDSVVFYLRLFELYSRLLGMSSYVIYSTSYYYKNLLLDFSLDFWHLYQNFFETVN